MVAEHAANGSGSNTVTGASIAAAEYATDALTSETEPSATTNGSEKKWPGWPGYCVFRMIVPVVKVGSIIGRKGELIKKTCEETRARIRILDAPLGTNDRIVLISGKEETESALSPAMEAVIRVFKRVCGLSEGEGESAAAGFCSIRFLVPSIQAINLIGKQGSSIKSIQETTGASVRVLSEGELPSLVAAEERVVDLQGEAPKVLKAIEAVVGHLRKFLVDQTVLPLFEKQQSVTVQQDRPIDPWADKPLHIPSSPRLIGVDYGLMAKREPLYSDLESRLESQITSSGLSGLPLYGQESALSGLRSSRIGRPAAPIVTQVTQTMQIPLTYAEDIIGVQGANIAYIRRTSGAVLTVQEVRGLPDEISVEIKGSATQVQTAQQLIQEFINGHQEPTIGNYGKMDTTSLRSYSHLGDTPYAPQSYTSEYSGYDSSSLGGYGSFRL